MEAMFIGEMLIDFTPGAGSGIYQRNAGGGAANACIAMAHNGLETGFLGKLGDDDFGHYLKEILAAEGVTYLCPKLTTAAVTTLAFVTLYENGERSFTFARKPGADMLLELADVKETDIEQVRLVHAASFCMSKSPAREAHQYAIKMAKEKGKLVSYDVNYRESVWGRTEAGKVIDAALPYVDFLKISDEELDFVGGEAHIQTLMKEQNITVVIETMGAAGAKLFFAGKEEYLPGHPVHAVDATGAGDAFWGGFLSKILTSGVNKTTDVTLEMVREAVRYGNAAGAICVQKVGGIPALPYQKEIEEYLAK